MRVPYLLAGILVLVIAHPSDVFGCAAGYESPESLVKRARLILEVEPLSVRDVPAPEKNNEVSLSHDEPLERKNAQATVKVVGVIKGKCDLRGFDLVGGPYYSCAPYPSYLHYFEKGKRVFLIFDCDLPVATKRVVITWRCRVFWGDNKEILSLMQNARDVWVKSLERYRAVAPDEFTEAKRLLKDSGGTLTAESLNKAPYAVLSCLRILLMNPDQVPQTAPTASEDTTGQSPESSENKGIYFTQQHKDYPLPDALLAAMKHRNKADPRETSTFNRELFSSFLRKDLLLSPAQIETVLGADGVTNSLAQTDFSPYHCDIRVNEKAKNARDVRSVYFLIALADDEPDSLVWRTFGLPDDIDLNANMFAAYVEKNMNRDYSAWPRLKLLLAVPHTKVAPLIQAALKSERNMYRLGVYFRFFVRLGDYDNAYTVLETFQALAFDDTIAKLSNERKKEYQERLFHLLKSFQDVMAGEQCDNAKLTGKLEDFKKSGNSIFQAPRENKGNTEPADSADKK